MLMSKEREADKALPERWSARSSWDRLHHYRPRESVARPAPVEFGKQLFWSWASDVPILDHLLIG